MSLRLLIPLALAVACWTQQAPQPSRLKINIISGNKSVNNIGMRVAGQPGVEVLDENNAPVAGAEVIFLAPSQGPSGSFYGGMQMHTVKTDAKGRAQASGFIPNDQPGTVRISVRVTSGSAVAETMIEQTNSQGPASGSKMSKNSKIIWTLIAVGAAVGIGVGVAMSGDDSSSSASSKKPVSIGAGPITVGGPR